MGIFDFLKKNKNIQNDNGVNKTYYDDGKGVIKSMFHKKNGKKNGPSKFFHKNGKVSFEINWIDDNHGDGHWKKYFENGQIMNDGNIKYGKRNGPWKDYYKNGQIWEIGNLKDDEKDGFWKVFSENGELDYEINYKNGKLHGDWKYYVNGQLYMSQKWCNGITDGNSISYYEDGQLKSEGILKVPNNYITPSDTHSSSVLLTEEYTWINIREQDGIWKFYNKNGKLESEVKYNEGEIISEICFDNDGNKIECPQLKFRSSELVVDRKSGMQIIQEKFERDDLL